MPQGGHNNLAGALNIIALREPSKAAGWTAGAQIELRWPHKPRTAPRAGTFQASQVGRPTRPRSGACALAVAHGASHPPSTALAARATKPHRAPPPLVLKFTPQRPRVAKIKRLAEPRECGLSHTSRHWQSKSAISAPSRSRSARPSKRELF